MVAADRTSTLKDKIIQMVEELPDDSLAELATFVNYLQFKEQKGSRWLKEMVESFSHVQDAVEESGMTETEINTMIDEAIDEVRRDRED